MSMIKDAQALLGAAIQQFSEEHPDRGYIIIITQPRKNGENKTDVQYITNLAKDNEITGILENVKTMVGIRQN